tara:strand:+ start:603 stop:1031 length:429 start_codon:yes stop_codon:yes gene_type:complete
MNLIKDQNKYFISIDKDEYVNQSLLDVANNENLKSGWISGVGAIYDIEVGYFDVEKKDYVRKKFSGDYELLSISGNISIKEGDRFVHTHITFSDIEFNVFGGHLFDAKVAAAGEFLIDLCDFEVKRKYNENLGLHLWCINNE